MMRFYKNYPFILRIIFLNLWLFQINYMNKIFTICAALIIMGGITSCNKTYVCQCVDNHNIVSQSDIKASSLSLAQTRCTDNGNANQTCKIQ